MEQIIDELGTTLLELLAAGIMMAMIIPLYLANGTIHDFVDAFFSGIFG